MSKKDSKKKGQRKKKKQGFFRRAIDFFKSVWYELKKVAWPTKSELTQHTSVVIVIVLITTLIVWVIDFGIGGILSLII